MPTRRISPPDSAWLRMDEPTNPMVITALLRLSSPPDPAALRQRLMERVIDPFPRFRQRPVAQALGMAWQDVPGWTLDAHLRHRSLSLDEETLAKEVGARMGELLPRDRPLWQIEVLHGPHGAALLVRLHHALADGFALARVLLSLADEGARIDRATPPEETGERLVQLGLDLLHHRHLLHDGPALRALAHQAHLGERSLRHLVFAPPDPDSPLHRPLGRQKRAAWRSLGSVEALRDVAHRHEVSINDLYVAALSGALRRRLGPGIGGPLRAFVPVNLRPLDQPIAAELGNRFGLVYLPLPVDLADPLARLAVVHAEVQRLKQTPEALVAFGILELMGAVPAVAEDLLVDLFASKGSAVVTNVPGPPEPLHLLGIRIEGIMFWVPQAGQVPLGTSLFSYAGEASLGVATDAGVLPEPQLLLEDMLRELEAFAR